MPKFRKKPIVITAEQFFADALSWPDGVTSSRTIVTLEGEHIVSEGDWIITGIKGEKYPCKPDIFEATYEPAE